MLDADAEAAPPPLPAPPPFRDGDDEINPAYVEAAAAAVAAGDAARVRALVEPLHEADLGALLEALAPALRPRLIALLGTSFDFTALTEVDDAVREEILDELEAGTLAEGVRDLDSDDAVYILEDLDRDEQARILDRLPAAERVALERSLEYPEDSAGRRMQTEFVAVPPFWETARIAAHLRAADDLPDTFHEVFVVDPAYHLVGAVPLHRLLRAGDAVTAEEIADRDVRRVRATDPAEEVARLFQRYNLVSAAVVDEGGRLVGVMTVDDVVDVIEEEADADIKALGGVSPAAELSDPVLRTVQSRFGWLFINLLTAFLASSVLKGFEAELEQMVALAVLAPVVASQGGNAGTQTMTVAVRALATRSLGAWNVARVITREALVGLLNGIGFAAITGGVAAAWFANPGLGVVIALAMVATLVAAALAGILIPLALDRAGADPAVSSGPFVTTVTDVVGFFAFLGIATLWFGLA